MKSIYILHKQNLIVVAMLLLLATSSGASAAGMITTQALGSYLTGEAVYILKVLTALTFLGGLIMIMVGSWGNNSWVKTNGYRAVAGVIVVVALYFIVPGIIETLSDLSSESTVFEFGGGSANNSSGYGGGW